MRKIEAFGNSIIEISLFIDNNPIYYRKVKYGLPVVDLYNFIHFYCKTVDSVLIAVSDMLIAQEMAVSLLNEKYNNIYFLPRMAWEAQLPILNGNGEFCSYIKQIKSCNPILPYIEYHVSDYCNLKCKRCGHFSNRVTEKVFPDVEEFQKSLSGLSQRFANVKTFRLMGGEPLVNTELDLFIYIVREKFPYADIRIVSNGLLLPKLGQKIVESIKKCGAVIEISQYPPTRDIIENVIEFLERNQLKFEISKEITEFFSCVGFSSIEDSKRIFSNCVSKTCYFLRGSRLCCCPAVALFYENSEFLELNISKEIMIKNSFDLIEGTENGWEILKKIFYPNDFCRYCTDVEWHKWSNSKKIKKEDWFSSK